MTSQPICGSVIDCALGPLIAGLQQRPPKGSEAQDVAQSAPAVGVFQTVAADEVGRCALSVGRR